MKNIAAGTVLMLITTSSYAATFECTGHFGGSTVGTPIKVNASKASVAETKAKARLKKAGHKIDYVTCSK